MFDLRYHVASLAAVFLALVVGILIGVGLTTQGVISTSERLSAGAPCDTPSSWRGAVTIRQFWRNFRQIWRIAWAT